MTTGLKIHQVSQRDLREINDLVDELASALSCAADASTVAAMCADAANRLPIDVSDFLYAYRKGNSGMRPVVVRMSAAFTPNLPATPNHWRSSLALRAGWRNELGLLLLSSVLGKPFAWCTQQGGRLVHDILPIREDENEQISTGSRQQIYWHVEDAFSAFRARYLALLCLRNPDQTPTTYSVPDVTRMPRSCCAALRQEHFFIRPDKSQESVRLNSQAPDSAEWVPPERRRIAVLEGGEHENGLRLDPYFMPQEELTVEARDALNALIAEIDSGINEIILQPGDCLFIDNAHCVHGRSPFKPRYDGTDRWLKRVNIATAESLACAVQICPCKLTYLPT